MTELCLSVINIYEIRQNDAASREPCGSGMVNDRYVNRASEALKTQMDSAFERRLSVYSKAPVTVGESATLRIGTDICSFPSPLCVEGCRPRHSRTHVTRKIPIHQVVTKRSLYPRKTIECRFLCSGANNTMCRTMWRALDTPAQHLPPTNFLHSNIPSISHCHSTSGGHDESWRIAAMLSYESSFHLLLVSSS